MLPDRVVALPRTVVVSAHLDDAVLSASGRLMAGDAWVLTVFAGFPAPGGDVPFWDRLTGATDSRQRVAERHAEDDEALGVLGVQTVRLDEVDEQYRSGPVDPDVLARRMADAMAGVREVWLPAGVGGNNDHLAAREAGRQALQLLARPVEQVRLYADVPYTATYGGWPRWVSGRPADPYLDADWWLEQDLPLRGLDPAKLLPEPRLLDPDELALKRRAVAAYRSQLPALRLTGLSAELEADILGVELSWRPVHDEAEAWP
jgi:LmbE family N-acetylglucosaminyl deacetylase